MQYVNIKSAPIDAIVVLFLSQNIPYLKYNMYLWAEICSRMINLHACWGRKNSSVGYPRNKTMNNHILKITYYEAHFFNYPHDLLLR